MSVHGLPRGGFALLVRKTHRPACSLASLFDARDVESTGKPILAREGSLDFQTAGENNPGRSPRRKPRIIQLNGVLLLGRRFIVFPFAGGQFPPPAMVGGSIKIVNTPELAFEDGVLVAEVYDLLRMHLQKL